MVAAMYGNSVSRNADLAPLCTSFSVLPASAMSAASHVTNAKCTKIIEPRKHMQQRSASGFRAQTIITASTENARSSDVTTLQVRRDGHADDVNV
eukprot:2226300-Prymnesium_polylepis.1